MGGGGGGGHCRHHQSGVLGYHNIPHTNYPMCGLSGASSEQVPATFAFSDLFTHDYS